MRRIALTLAALALTSLVTYGGYRAWTATSPYVEPLTMVLAPHDFSLRIPAEGELQSGASIAIAVPNVPARRLRIGSVVPDGRFVQKGDTLLEFDPTELDLQANEHRKDLDMAVQKIRRGELAVDVEKTDIVKDKKIAELELIKINEFLPKDDQIYSRREIIEGQLDRDFTVRKIVFADARLRLKGRVYSLDEAILHLEREQAKTKINQVEKALASLTLVSPDSGIVVYNDPGYFYGGTSLFPGRIVWIGMTLFNLVNPDLMEAKCFVLEKDAGELQVGQPAIVSLDPFPGVRFSGRVKTIDKIARSIDRDSPVKYFQTILSLDTNDRKLMKPGIKLKIEILAGELKSVLVLPRSAIIAKEGVPMAFVRRSGGGFDPVPVELGRGDRVRVVVTRGVEAGQILAMNPPDFRTDFTKTTKK